MKRIFSSPIAALVAGLALRLFFVLRFPADSGDTVLYEQITTNWLKHYAYAMDVHGALTPVDLRMPGYPVFLALVYAITWHTGESARLWVRLAQVLVDLLGCLVIAVLAAGLLLLADTSSQMADPIKQMKRVFTAGLWLAVLCPFSANYTAVLLTETLAIFLTAVATVLLTGVAANSHYLVFPKPRRRWEPTWSEDFRFFAASSGLAVGFGTLFRPEAPLLLVAAWVGNAFVLLPHRQAKHLLRIILYTSVGCVVPLVPWGLRNAVTLHEFQILAPKYSTLPGELVPYGFMAWEKTWLYRVRDCYLVSWKLNEESIDIDAIPARAFDSPEEKGRVAVILEQYNDELTLTPEEDAAFGQIARERTARHPLRTYLWVPAARAAVIWLSPRIELLPISGHVFPLAYMREEDPVDQEFTSLLFMLNIVYVGLGVWGGVRLWRASVPSRPVILFFVVFILLRTAFLTTLETPEPRYVLVCFPLLMALGAQLFVRMNAQPSPG
ncbi:MAG TPA: hypothetical protein VE263_06355 [Candidatus Angelobacter sp.]|nr:hypothetical protein [Candidatus Angelobacter sp.]